MPEVCHVLVLGNIKIMFFKEKNKLYLLWRLKINCLNKTKQKTSKSLKHRRKKHCILLKEYDFSGGAKIFICRIQYVPIEA